MAAGWGGALVGWFRDRAEASLACLSPAQTGGSGCSEMVARFGVGGRLRASPRTLTPEMDHTSLSSAVDERATVRGLRVKGVKAEWNGHRESHDTSKGYCSPA